MFLGAAGAQLVRKLCLMVRTHVNICGNDKRLKHRTSPSSKTHAVLFEFMRKASAYLIFNLAERVGFEPTVPRRIASFQDWCLKPLGHLSITNEVYRNGTHLSRWGIFSYPSSNKPRNIV